MLFPNGLAGLWDDYGHHITNKFRFISKGFRKIMPQAVLKKLKDAN
jgi:urea transport system permease protein